MHASNWNEKPRGSVKNESNFISVKRDKFPWSIK